jgi:hypothetical protein
MKGNQTKSKKDRLKKETSPLVGENLDYLIAIRNLDIKDIYLTQIIYVGRIRIYKDQWIKLVNGVRLGDLDTVDEERARLRRHFDERYQAA